MKSNYYQLYVQSCIALIQTLVIKSEETAYLINEYLNLQIGNNSQNITDYYDPTNKATWKYYLNLSGEYVEPFDTVIYIKSLDTLQDIKFSPQNLSQNPLTAQAYQFGSQYYLNLIAQYPNQIPLINSILYPCDINTAIAANDGAILAYSSELVESNEVSLIASLQEWIDKYKSRWNVRGFQVTDSLYTVSNLGIMYSLLVPVLLNARLHRAKTPEAHSFHVSMYLASHGNLASLITEFSLGEKLNLYRNINYIEKHAGFQSTFQSLIDNFITPNGIDLVTYRLKHTGFDTSNEPITSLQQVSLTNPTEPRVNYTLSEVLGYEAGATNDNAKYIQNYGSDITTSLQYSRYTDVPTKIIKTNIQSNIPLVEHTKESLVMNTWLYFAVNGYYNAKITFTNPIDQNSYSLSAIDMFLYMVYIEATALGISLTYVPPYLVSRAPILYYMSETELSKYVDSTNLPLTGSDIDLLISNQVAITPLTTVAEFQAYCDAVYSQVEAQDIYVNSIGDISRRVQYKIMIDRLYVDEIIDFPSTYETISDWLNSKNLPIYSYTIAQAELLLETIVKAATGFNYNPNKGLNFNPDLVSMVASLSSYNLQFIINQEKTTVFIINNGISVDSMTLEVTYVDANGNQYADITHSAGYDAYGESGFIGYQLYEALSTTQKNQLTDIYQE